MDLSELYRDIVETSPDGIWVIDLDGRTAVRQPGDRAASTAIRRRTWPALTVFDTLDEAGQRAVRRPPRRRARQGRVNPSEVEVQWVRSDGDIVWVLCRESALLRRRRASRGRCCTATPTTPSGTTLIASLRASEDALEDQVAQNNLMQAVASAANEATSLADVLVQARAAGAARTTTGSGRARSCPAPTAPAGVEPFYPSDEPTARPTADDP